MSSKQPGEVPANNESRRLRFLKYVINGDFYDSEPVNKVQILLSRLVFDPCLFCPTRRQVDNAVRRIGHQIEYIPGDPNQEYHVEVIERCTSIIPTDIRGQERHELCAGLMRNALHNYCTELTEDFE